MAAVTITAASIVPVAGYLSETSYLSGAAITQGQGVYLDTATNTWKLSDSDASAATAGSAGVGIALTTTTAAGQPLVVMVGGSLGMGACLTNGLQYYLGPVAGTLVPSADLAAPSRVTLIGVASGTSTLVMRPWATGVLLA